MVVVVVVWDACCGAQHALQGSATGLLYSRYALVGMVVVMMMRVVVVRMMMVMVAEIMLAYLMRDKTKARRAHVLVMVMGLGPLGFTKRPFLISVVLCLPSALGSVQLGHHPLRTRVVNCVAIIPAQKGRGAVADVGQVRNVRRHGTRHSHGADTSAQARKHAAKLVLDAGLAGWTRKLRLRALHRLRNRRETPPVAANVLEPEEVARVYVQSRRLLVML
jgi:hypothetical protein